TVEDGVAGMIDDQVAGFESGADFGDSAVARANGHASQAGLAIVDDKHRPGLAAPAQGADGNQQQVLAIPHDDARDRAKTMAQPLPLRGRIEQPQDHFGALLLDSQGAYLGKRRGTDTDDLGGKGLSAPALDARASQWRDADSVGRQHVDRDLELRPIPDLQQG